MRKIVSFLLIAVFLIVPVSAASSSGTDVEYIQKSSFWTWAAGKGKPLNGIIGNIFGAVCPNSEDGYHHASSYERPIGNWTVESGYYKCICDLCGAEFKAYEKDLQQSYDAQVAELPAQSVTAAGKLIWQTTWDDYYSTNSDTCTTIAFTKGDSYITVSRDSLSSGLKFGSVSVPLSVVSPTTLFLSWDGGYRSPGIALAENYLKAPVSGYYCIDSDFLVLSIEYVDEGSGLVKSCTMRTDSSPSSSYSPLAKCYVSAGDWFRIRTFQPYSLPSSNNYVSSCREYLYAYPISIELDTFGPVLDTTYNINSRPTSITGDYGIIGDNGQIIKVEGDKIVNETNNTYYNPATGETTTITDWSYNYEDRSYTVTTESGDTVTITYGDENVTIKEGDTIYNVYYLVNGSGSENPGPDVPPACNHQWTETSTTPATCTVPGSRTLTCSLCNETKTETIPAPGHKWTIKQEVKNEYDENGNQTQEGYTIWECSVCGEQQKTTDGTAPPGGGSGTGSGSSGGVFSGIFGLLVDFLGFFWNTFRDFVGEGVKGFLNALMDGTSPIFGLLNPFNWGG